MDKIAVIGVGRLGLCFVLNLEQAGFEVLGIDIGSAYLSALQNRSFESPEPFVTDWLKKSKALFTHDYNALVEENITDIFIMVATPSLPDGGYDHDQVDDVVQRLIELPFRGETKRNLYVGCTTMPGYCDSLQAKLAGSVFTLTYNPEFIAQGSIITDQQHPDQVLIGGNDEVAIERLIHITSRICGSVPVNVMDLKSAEIAKLAINCYLTMKISFANSIGDLAIKAAANAESILRAVGGDSRIGTKNLKYGYGFGGPCFPRDNAALISYATSVGGNLPLSKATVEVNDEHFKFQLSQKLASISEQETLVMDGVAYKTGTDILTGSQQLKMAVSLANSGRKVIIRDSKRVIYQVQQLHPDLFLFEPTD